MESGDTGLIMNFSLSLDFFLKGCHGVKICGYVVNTLASYIHNYVNNHVGHSDASRK